MSPIKIIQRTFPFSKLTFTVESNRELSIAHSTLLRSTREAIPLQIIDPSPIYHRSTPLGWVIATIVPLAGLIAAVIDGWITQGLGEKFGIVFLLGIFLACLINTMKLSRNTIHYRNVNTSAIIFSMFRSKPSQLAVDDFCKNLKARIESFSSPAGISREEMAELYKRHLDYLLESNVIHAQEYEIILQRLSEKSANKRVFELVR
nr:hypothetical protein [uncultured Pseudomonas sp.]